MFNNERRRRRAGRWGRVVAEGMGGEWVEDYLGLEGLVMNHTDEGGSEGEGDDEEDSGEDWEGWEDGGGELGVFLGEV